jgi:hypothetical protein
MSRPVVEQRRLQYRGREFHFVSYAGLPARAKRAQAATTPAWWLMSAGRRWEVMPFDCDRDAAELGRAFTAWLDAHVFRSLPTRAEAEDGATWPTFGSEESPGSPPARDASGRAAAVRHARGGAGSDPRGGEIRRQWPRRTMSNRIEYNGHVIEATTKLKSEPYGWTLEVHIAPVGSDTRIRRCRAPNTYPSEEAAVARCLEFGRQIVDGKLQPKVDPTK